jgi:hypothetical protein
MTDEEIIALAEKTKKEKYCDKYNNGNTDYFCRDSTCEEKHCPLFYGVDGYYDCCIDCEDYYKDLFLDGFKAAMEYFNQIIKKLNTDDKFDDDFNYYGGYKRAFRDIQEELGMEYDKD